MESKIVIIDTSLVSRAMIGFRVVSQITVVIMTKMLVNSTYNKLCQRKWGEMTWGGNDQGEHLVGEMTRGGNGLGGGGERPRTAQFNQSGAYLIQDISEICWNRLFSHHFDFPKVSYICYYHCSYSEVILYHVFFL